MDKRLLLISLAMFFLITLLPIGPVQAQNEVGNFIFIFDGSTSMWKTVNGEYKLVIAKDAMKGVVEHLPDHINAALMSYGHRVESDCTDVEALVALQPLDKKLLKQTIQNINPKGRTPITYALQQALALLPGGREPTSIVLLTDGIENCEGDPCSVIKEAKSRGLNFQLDIIGFGVPEVESADLQCSATAGDGRYFTAGDADELVSALDQATDPAQIIAMPSSATAGNSSITASFTAPAAAGTGNDNTMAGKPDPGAASSSKSAAPAVTAMNSKPGTDMAASETASESERQTKPADAVNPAMGKMAAAQIPDPSASIAERSSTSATAKEAVSQTKADANAGQQTAEPEEPALTATEDAEQTDAETTTVAALTMSSRSDSNDIIMEAPSEVTAGSAFNVKWDGSAEAWDYITTVEANASEGSYSQYAYTKDGKLLTLQAPQIPGDYEIRYVEGATQNTLTRLLITVR